MTARSNIPGRGPTIGVFDSGFGGLTVLRALLPLIPGAHYVYLGDTARLPYGAKSATTIARYAVESAQFLVGKGCDHLVIACNTATALALPEIRRAVPVPAIGVIEPGAKAALAALNPSTEFSSEPDPTLKLSSRSALTSEFSSRSGLTSKLSSRPERSAVERPAAGTTPQTLVLATTATVHSHAYSHACETLGLQAIEVACPLLVPLVEEGWTDHPVTRDVLRIYLAEALKQCQPDVVLLGCTHYPLIAGQIERILRELGSHANVVDSAQATAQATRDIVLASRAQDRPLPPPTPATFACFATDSTEKFARLGSHFLGQMIAHVELLDLGG